VREIRMLRSRWRGLETESRLGLRGHERGNPGHRQDHDLTDHRASPRPYRGGKTAQIAPKSNRATTPLSTRLRRYLQPGVTPWPKA